MKKLEDLKEEGGSKIDRVFQSSRAEVHESHKRREFNLLNGKPFQVYLNTSINVF